MSRALPPVEHYIDPDRHVVVAMSDYAQDNPEPYIREVLANHGYEQSGDWVEIDVDPHLGFPHRRFAGPARSTWQHGREITAELVSDPGPDEQDLDNWFTYHPPGPADVVAYTQLRRAGYDLARQIIALAPGSRERSTALAKVREAVMWANAAIACNPPEEES